MSKSISKEVMLEELRTSLAILERASGRRMEEGESARPYLLPGQIAVSVARKFPALPIGAGRGGSDTIGSLAKGFGIGVRTLDRAHRVLRLSPKIADKVLRGEIDLKKAEVLAVKQVREEQDASP